MSNKAMSNKVWNLPNILTYGRIAAVPIVAGCIYAADIMGGGFWLRWTALVIYIIAAITDYFDGYFARSLNQYSTLGKMLDPIADKLLIAACLLMLAAGETIKGWALWAAVIILCREILVSGLREFLAEVRVSVPVSFLAKWKTTVQLIAVGFLIAGEAGDELIPYTSTTGLVLLWIAAGLTLYTGYDYFKASAKHLTEEE
jgi:cardiolipin synthase (CMP-forming)